MRRRLDTVDDILLFQLLSLGGKNVKEKILSFDQSYRLYRLRDNARLFAGGQPVVTASIVGHGRGGGTASSE